MTGSLVIEGGGDFPDEPGDAEPNFNREGAPHVSAVGADRPRGGDRGGDRGRGGRPGGGGGGVAEVEAAAVVLEAAEAVVVAVPAAVAAGAGTRNS